MGGGGEGSILIILSAFVLSGLTLSLCNERDKDKNKDKDKNTNDAVRENDTVKKAAEVAKAAEKVKITVANVQDVAKKVENAIFLKQSAEIQAAKFAEGSRVWSKVGSHTKVCDGA